MPAQDPTVYQRCRPAFDVFFSFATYSSLSLLAKALARSALEACPKERRTSPSSPSPFRWIANASSSCSGVILPSQTNTSPSLAPPHSTRLSIPRPSDSRRHWTFAPTANTPSPEAPKRPVQPVPHRPLVCRRPKGTPTCHLAIYRLPDGHVLGGGEYESRRRNWLRIRVNPLSGRQANDARRYGGPRQPLDAQARRHDRGSTGFLHRDGRVLREHPDEGSLRSGGPRVSKFLSPESFVFRR
jgi:hypothetical protein